VSATAAGVVEATDELRGVAGCGVTAVEGLAISSFAVFDEEKSDIGSVKNATNGFVLFGFSSVAAGGATGGVTGGIAGLVPE
jgi:hypothetical protein